MNTSAIGGRAEGTVISTRHSGQSHFGCLMKKMTVMVCTATFTRMWLAGTPTRIIAETLKISADKADTTRRQLGLPRRESWHGAKTGLRKAYLPTTTEIREACLKFQAGWTDEERARRKVGRLYEPPVEARVIPESFFQFDGNSETTGFLEDLADRETSG